jgi:hypothetical protein
MKNEKAMEAWEKLAFKNDKTDSAVNDLLEKIAGDKYITEGDDPIVETIESLTSEEVAAFLKGCEEIEKQDAYRQVLKGNLERAMEDFEEARAKALRYLESITTRDAADFGAAYGTHIDKITQAGARVEEIKLAMRAFDYIMK